MAANTSSELIDALGGSRKVSVLVSEAHKQEITPARVTNWRQRGFPTWARPTMQKLARSRRIQVAPKVVEFAPAGSGIGGGSREMNLAKKTAGKRSFAGRQVRAPKGDSQRPKNSE